MSTSTSLPYEWIRKIPSSLLKLDEIPLFGSPPEFRWDQLQTELQTLFQIEELIIETSNFEWTVSEDLFKKLGEDLTPLQIHIPTLDGAAFWVMNRGEISELISLLLQEKSNPFDTVDPDFQEGFYKFLALEAIHALCKSGFDPALVPQIQSKAKLPQSEMLCLDVTLKINERMLFGRLYISPELRSSFKKQHEKSDTKSLVRPPLSEKIEITVHLEVGHTKISLAEWSKVCPGDVVILDDCTLEPESDKGKVMLTVQGYPFFRGKVKDGNIKILENPLYYETERGMDNFPPDEEEENDEYETTEEEDLDFSEEELEDFDNEESGEFSEESEEPAEEESEETPSVEEKPPAKTVTQAHLQKDEERKGPRKPEEIILPVIAEVGRLQMTIQTLMELQPGNILDLNVHPKDGIDLVVNGNRIGKGELIQIGDVLGVRVLEMG